MQVGKYLGSVKVGVFGAVLAVALAGCTELTPTGGLPDTPSSSASSATDSSVASSSVAPSTSAAPTTTYTPEEQAVIDQYKGYFEGIHSLRSPSPDQVQSALAPYAQQALIDQIKSTFASLAASGTEPGGDLTFGPIQVVALGDNATVYECRDSSGELIVSVADGSTVNTGKPGTRITAEVFYEDGVGWRLYSVKIENDHC